MYFYVCWVWIFYKTNWLTVHRPWERWVGQINNEGFHKVQGKVFRGGSRSILHGAEDIYQIFRCTSCWWARRQTTTTVCSEMLTMRENETGMLKWPCHHPQIMISKGEKDIETIERTAWLKVLCFYGIIKLIKGLEFVSNIIRKNVLKLKERTSLEWLLNKGYKWVQGSNPVRTQRMKDPA